MNDRIHIITHPMVQHKLTLLRDKNTGMKEFRECLREISGLLSYEATHDLLTKQTPVETPYGMAEGYTIEGRTIALIPILRAGLEMVDGILQFIPVAKVGHVGLYRDPSTLRSVQYYCKMPSDINEREAILLDPVIATGSAASAAIEILKNYKCKSIKLMCVVASKKAVEEITRKYDDVEMYCAAIDDIIDERGCLVPGIGDAGDRVYGTK